MKISQSEMQRRVQFAQSYFTAHPDASVAEMNRELEKKGEHKMGAIAYEVKDQIKRKRRGKPVAANVKPTNVKPVTDEVASILGSLAKRLVGTNIKEILLDVSGAQPVVRYTEMTPQQREVVIKQ